MHAAGRFAFLRLPVRYAAYIYAQSARYVLNFLNGALKGDRGGFDYLMKKPEQLGMPRHSVHRQFFAARP